MMRRDECLDEERIQQLGGSAIDVFEVESVMLQSQMCRVVFYPNHTNAGPRFLILLNSY